MTREALCSRCKWCTCLRWEHPVQTGTWPPRPRRSGRPGRSRWARSPRWPWGARWGTSSQGARRKRSQKPDGLTNHKGFTFFQIFSWHWVDWLTMLPETIIGRGKIQIAFFLKQSLIYIYRLISESNLTSMKGEKGKRGKAHSHDLLNALYCANDNSYLVSPSSSPRENTSVNN